MSSISDYEHMAMLELSDNERDRLNKRFGAVCSALAGLEEFDTNGVLPLVTVLDEVNVMREDKCTKFISRDELLQNTPEQQDGYIRVPATID